MERVELFIARVMLWKADCLNIQHINLLFMLAYLLKSQLRQFFSLTTLVALL